MLRNGAEALLQVFRRQRPPLTGIIKIKPSLEDSKFKLRFKGVAHLTIMLKKEKEGVLGQDIVKGQLVNILSFAGCKISVVILNLIQKLPQTISA